MSHTATQLFSYLDDLDIEHQTVEHPPVFTVEEAKAWYHKIPGMHCKNLFMKDKNGQLWLVVMPSEKRADIGRITKSVGAAKLSFANPEVLMEALGITPGSVTPFALINDTNKSVTVVLDKDMLDSEMVNYHPLHNAASTTVRTSDLLKFVQALGYQPHIIDCGKE